MRRLPRSRIRCDMPRQTKSRARKVTGKRYPLNMRTTKETRERLENAAALSGRSLVQEVERRLENYFERDQEIQETFGSRRNYRLMQMIATIITRLEVNGRAGADWLDDPDLFDRARAVVLMVMDSVRPRRERPDTGMPSPEAEIAAATFVNSVRNTDHRVAPELRSSGKNLKARFNEELGDLLDRRPVTPSRKQGIDE